MACTFDKDGNLLRFEAGGIWFNASHYHEPKGDKSRDFPMGSLQSSVAEYEHRTGKRGTMAIIEAERAKWMESPERLALLAPEPTLHSQAGDKPVLTEVPAGPMADANAEMLATPATGAMASVKEPVMVKGGPKAPKKQTPKAKKA